ncbi:hypothetical protein CROQUDRAFT_60400 [Cronartium quercuum f. sp. fusiforme G11]|uniref:Plus3 domain-containing protein n=1 Tax=Cronartium quercuum f. sp. fusiforme G11 TaxID=708437 RepID=A0A9P6TDN1_9BASI|nr:hypothetical protein CROQUDRAFT_60400 [Cronartium quercuum f. sp. fusiforme G11]
MADLDDELLALAGDITKSSSTKRPLKLTSNNKKIKRRKRMDMDSESDMEMSSDSEGAIPMDVEHSEDDDDGQEIRTANTNPYPYEGIYIDVADKKRIQSLSELEREAILGERQDELQKIRDRENVKNMVRARDEESSKRSSGREKSRTGTTYEKAQKLDELKMKRQEKGKRPKPEDVDPTQARRKSGKDLDWDASEDEEVDLNNNHTLVIEEPSVLDHATIDDIRSVMLTRKRAVELCFTTFFQEYVKGMWVRVSVGFDPDDPKREIKYRVGEVLGVSEASKYYEVENQATKVELQVVIAKSEKLVRLDRISNSPFQENEWAFSVGECQKHNVAIPTKKEISRKLKNLENHRDWVKDETVITKQVRAKKEMRDQGQGPPTTLSITERLRLQSERDQAAAKGETELYERLVSRLEQATPVPIKAETRMAGVNERNRRANREEIRRAEIAAAESRRQQMKALEAGRAVKVDASARVRITPKMTYETKSDSSSRALTPASDGSTPVKPTSVNPSVISTLGASGLKGTPTRFEEMIASQVQVDIDIGDF